MAITARQRYGVSVRFVCHCLDISVATYYYRPRLSAANQQVADWLLRLTTANKRWGFGLCYLYLRIKPRRRIKRDKPDALSVPLAPNQVWSIDFMSDSLTDGRTIRTFNVLDDYNREGLGIEVDQSLPSARVIKALERIMEWRGKPAAIRCDNGPEYVSQSLVNWANEHQITLMYIQPGKPTQNAYIERFNRTVRHEWLDMHLFESIEHAQHLATDWLWKYNNERPNSAIGGIPPRQLLKVA